VTCKQAQWLNAVRWRVNAAGGGGSVIVPNAAPEGGGKETDNIAHPWHRQGRGETNRRVEQRVAYRKSRNMSINLSSPRSASLNWRRRVTSSS
jgi:hypothetical protein